MYDGCSADPNGGAGGAPGEAPVKCESYQDPVKNLFCKTCYAADGQVVATDCVPTAPAGEGSGLTCSATKDGTTGQICMACVDPSGKLAFTDCGTTPAADGAPPPKK